MTPEVRPNEGAVAELERLRTLAEIGRLWLELIDEEAIAWCKRKAHNCRATADMYRSCDADGLAEKEEQDAERLEQVAALMQGHMDV